MLALPAPAKLNLYLHITGKRSDGYHLLDTAFQLIELQDTVTLAVRRDGQIILHTPIAGLRDAQHLAMKAAHLLKSHTRCALGADIWVEKRIPSGAGLGGGSSDAATTLMGLNQLWQCGLSTAQLQALGLQLGADVPFFCSTLGTARGLGIGEVLTALPSPRKHYLVAYPNCHLATPSVFKHPALAWDAARDPAMPLSDVFAKGFDNDLQTVAQTIAPAIANAIAWLKCAPHVEGVRMSGSGSAVFAQFAQPDQAEQALLSLRHQTPAMARDWPLWCTPGLDAHPILAAFSTPQSA
jgi:4-diphosphocytidyl-2-C-methyl-D-erythritol kinase